MNVLEVTGLKKKLGKREIIKGINLSIKEGEIFGFLGPNGAVVEEKYCTTLKIK